MTDLIRHLDSAKNKGFNGGKTGNPPPHSTSPDTVEVEYGIMAKNIFNKENAIFSKQCIDIKKNIGNIESELDEFNTKLESLPALSSIEEKINSKLHSDNGKYKKVYKDSLQSEASLKAFKLQNSIHRPATYPVDLNSHFSWIFLLIIIEGLTNAYFFSANVGLFVGALTALLFSLINVGIGVSSGIAFRFKNSKEDLLKTFGWICIFIAILILVWINSTTATFRSITEVAKLHDLPIELDVLWMQAAKSSLDIFLLQVPFKEMNGFLLFFIGLLAGGFSIWKGYTLFDPIIGYTPLDKLAKENEAKWNNIEKEIHFMAKKEFTDSKEIREDLIKNIKKQRAICSKIDAEFKQKKSSIESKILEIKLDYKQLIVAYRAAVSAVTPVGIPSYFHEDPYLELNIHETSITSIISDIEYITRKANDIYENYSQKLNDQIHGISSLTGEVTNATNKFYEQLKNDATKELAASVPSLNIK